VLKALFLMLAALNSMDAALTLAGLHYELITEANPVMRILYEMHPAAFTCSKLSFSLFLLLFVFTGRVPSSPIIKVLSIAAAFLYSAVLLAHLHWIRLLIG